MATIRRRTYAERMAEFPEWATALPAGDAEATPTTTPRQTGSGVQTRDAVPTRSDGQGAGRTLTPPTPERIKDGAGSIAQLMKWARFLGQSELPAKEFVQKVFETPWPPREKRADNLRNNAHVDGRLHFWGVMSIARAFDKEGASTPAEFVNAFSCEVTGNARGEAVMSLLRGIGRETRPEPVDEESLDDYARWRYGVAS